MRAGPPEGWEEVFSGPCLQADLVQAVLEIHELRPVTQSFSPQVWWTGSVFEDCRVYVPTEEAAVAREILQESDGERGESDDEPSLQP